MSVNQSIEDLANFIKNMKVQVSGLEKSKVILAGGSYSASMVTWFKKLYPNAVQGCWASSAPLEARVDFYGKNILVNNNWNNYCSLKAYRESMDNSLNLMGGKKCYKRIKNGIKSLEDLLDTGKVAELQKILQLCYDFDKENVLDVWSLFYVISELFAALIQGHK